MLAVGLPMALAGAPLSEVQGATPPSSPATAGDGFFMPADWTAIVDDTNTISVAVPDAWVDIDTAPDSNPDGTLAPRIGAATNLDVFTETFDAPGVLFRAVPYTANNEAAMTESDRTAGCRHRHLRPYDDGAFVGLRAVWSSCGATGAPERHLIVASPASHSFTFIVEITTIDEDETATLDSIVRSFNFTPQGGLASGPRPAAIMESAPSASATIETGQPERFAQSTPPLADPEVEESTAPPLPTVSNTLAVDPHELGDDLGVLSVAVPGDWAETDTTPRSNDDGSDRPWIAASTDLDVFLPPSGVADTFSVPGVLFTALPYVSDVSQPLSQYGYTTDCTDEGVQPYAGGTFTGLVQLFTDCGGTSTRIFIIAANPADRSVTVFALLQLTGDDDTAYDIVLPSLRMVDRSSGSSSATT